MNAGPKFAIIGCGRIAMRHAEEAAKNGRLIAVCDTIPEKADVLASHFSAKAYYDIDTLLSSEKEIDIIAVCTPNGLHAAHSIQALQSGFHVLCEKPLSISSADARQMITIAEKNKRKLFVVKSTRFNPALASLKEMVGQDKLGRIYSFQLNCFWNRPRAYYTGSWRGSLALDGGTLYTQFSHYIDAALWLFGDMKKATGFRKNAAHTDSIEFEDSGVAALEMENGILGGINWSVNAYQKNMEVSLSVLGEKGSVRIGGEYMNKIEYQMIDQLVLETGAQGQANDYGFYKGSMSNHDKIYENLVKALKDENHAFTSARDGLKTVETIERIYQALVLQ